MIYSYRVSEHNRATEDNMTIEGVVIRKNNNVGISLGNVGIIETGSEG